MGANDYVLVEVDLIRRIAADSMLVEVGGAEFWLPKACVRAAGMYQEGERDVTLAVTERIAREKGLEGE